MSISEENPVNAIVACQQLGQPGKPWSAARLSAIKRAMGLTHVRYFFLSDVRRWIRQHPEFRLAHVYPKKPRLNPARPCNPKGPRRAAAGKSDAR